MSFWEDYLKNPPFEVTLQTTGESTDSHAVLRRGYENFDLEELWDFGSGMSWHTYPLPLPSFLEHGGRTLCGLPIHSGLDMYAPRWNAFSDTIGEGREDPALLDLHGISCMVCRRRLMHDVCRIVERLTSLRDSVGEEYVLKSPLIHGKHILSSERRGGTISETYRLRCNLAAEEINPRLVDGEKDFGRITCPDCTANFTTGASDE